MFINCKFFALQFCAFLLAFSSGIMLLISSNVMYTLLQGVSEIRYDPRLWPRADQMSRRVMKKDKAYITVDHNQFLLRILGSAVLFTSILTLINTCWFTKIYRDFISIRNLQRKGVPIVPLYTGGVSYVTRMVLHPKDFCPPFLGPIVTTPCFSAPSRPTTPLSPPTTRRSTTTYYTTPACSPHLTPYPSSFIPANSVLEYSSSSRYHHHPYLCPSYTSRSSHYCPCSESQSCPTLTPDGSYVILAPKSVAAEDSTYCHCPHCFPTPVPTRRIYKHPFHFKGILVPSSSGQLEEDTTRKTESSKGETIIDIRANARSDASRGSQVKEEDKA